MRAWTALAYVGAGVDVFVLQGDGESAVFAAALAFLGVGTFLYPYRRGGGAAGPGTSTTPP